MRSGLFWKLFLLQLLAAAAVLAGALALSRTYSVRGFAEYLETHDRRRVQELAQDVAEAYGRSGDLVAAANEVRALQPRRRKRLDDGPHAPPAGERHRRHPPEHEEATDDGVHLRSRIIVRRQVGEPPLQLQDAAGTVLAGDRRPLNRDRLREPIEVDGRTVGYLAWPRLPEHPAQEAFARQQLHHLTVIVPVGLLVAALFAALITALIVRPIRQLSAGATALARREFGTRLPEARRDEIGRLAADFNRLAEALERFDSRQRQWLADIAHELRTPLAVLRGELDALLEGVRTFGPGTVESLSQEVSRLEGLINDLHLVSLAESGGLRLNLSDSDVGGLAEQAAKRFAPRFRTRDFELKISIEPGLRARVDVQRLDQVLGNLLGNAMAHATPPGPVTLSVFAEGSQVVIAVADAGPGVPDDALPRLFDRLFRVESARSRPSGGSGLGLSICKSIVEAHGGTIGARKSAAGGLEILIRLPRT